MTILYYREGIHTSEDRLINELNTLQCLSRGLGAIDISLRAIEQKIYQQDAALNRKSYYFGFDFLERYGIDPSVEFLIPCYFHWFSSTLCNYVRLVGIYKGIQEGKFDEGAIFQPSQRGLVGGYCGEYLESIAELKPIRRWRNKVFAHFALTDPRNDDTSEMLQLSTISVLEFQDYRFRVRQIQEDSASDGIELWSITETFESLAPRFWPEYPKR